MYLVTSLLKASLIFSVLSIAHCSRVLELSDKFIGLSGQDQWLVKFYAPWCAHCRRLEPVWSHVAQSLYSTPIKVAKVDCTRFPTVAAHFKVNAYPTIKFLKGTFQHDYNGERTKDEIVNYALRMSQPPVQRLTHADSIGYLKEAHTVFFGYVGKQTGQLWETYVNLAETYQPHSWFYAMAHNILQHDVTPPNETSIFVYKDDEAYFFEANSELVQDGDALNTSLHKWIHAERFGTFPKITRSNINELMDTEKYLVLVIVSENKLEEITQTERDFKDMVEGIIRKRKRELHNRFQFGWIGSPDLANSIAMSELSVPNLLVLNSTTSHHHMPDDDPVLMTPEAISMFLDQVHNQMAPTYGGTGLGVRLYRAAYEARATLGSMWRGNPVLTALVFGLPLGFLSLICYSVCCADILDAEEEEDSSDSHEKKD